MIESAQRRVTLIPVGLPLPLLRKLLPRRDPEECGCGDLSRRQAAFNSLLATARGISSIPVALRDRAAMPRTFGQASSWTATHRDTAPGLDPGRLSETIGLIYDCVVDPARWPVALAAICEEFSLDSGIIGVERFAPMQAVCQYSVGVETEWLERIPEYLPEILELWGGRERVHGYPLDEPIVNSHAVDEAIVSKNRYAQEWRRRGISDAVMMILAREPSLIGSVAFNRHETAGALTADETDGLRMLGPHFRRAVTISNLFDMKTVETANFTSVIDAFSCGVLLIDARQEIIYANRPAAAMLAAREPIEAHRGVLAIRDADAAGALKRTLQGLLAGNRALGSRGIGIPLRRADGAPCVLHVLPLQSGELRSRFGRKASAALFLAPAAAVEPPMAALTLLFDLTPAEARVCELLVRGMRQRTIAETIGVAPSTVKTHLLRLYAKTGCRRQSDLVAIAKDLSVPF